MSTGDIDTTAVTELGDSIFTTEPDWELWDDKPEIVGESDTVVPSPEGDEEEFDYELELKRQEQALMEKYGMPVGHDEYDGYPLTSHMIEVGLSNIGRALDTTLLAYLTLEASSRNLCDINQLESYTNLTTVILYDNKLHSLKPLKKIKNLKVLNVQGNLIENLEAIPLKNFKWLQALNLGHNKLQSLQGIQPNTLLYLHLARNSLDSIELLTGDIFPNLLSLELRGNQLNSIEGLNLPKLRQLFIAENFLRDLSGINGCPALETLHARQNRIQELTIWPEMKNLEYLNLRENRIWKFTEAMRLENCPNLKTLIFTGNPICDSERYRAEILGACITLKRLDRTLLSELEIVEGRRHRAKRQNGTIPPVEDDLTIVPDLYNEDEGESVDELMKMPEESPMTPT